MRRLPLFLVLLIATAPPCCRAQQTETVHFGKRPSEPGARLDQAVRVTMRLDTQKMKSE